MRKEQSGVTRHTVRAVLFAAVFLTVLACMLTLPAAADVSFTQEKEADYGKVGVVGNPDFYPYEYYDPDTGEYKGVFPELFEKLSAICHLDFQYVDCGNSDLRLVDEKTGYGQIISAYVVDSDQMEKYLITDEIPVVSYENNGQTVTICLAFGKYADQTVIDKVTAGMAALPEGEISSLLAKYISAGERQQNLIVYIAVIFVLLVLIGAGAALLMYFYMREKQSRRTVMQQEATDTVTGLGNRKYLEKEFGKVVAFQSRNAYVFAYIGFDIGKINRRYGEGRAEELLRQGAELLKSRPGKSDILGRVSGGAFGVFHVSSTAEETKQWASETVGQLNAVGAQLFDHEDSAEFHAGVYCLTDGSSDFPKTLKMARMYYEMAAEEAADAVVSDDDTNQEKQLNAILEGDIDKALAEGQFVQHIQPIVRAADGSVFAGEGLARWNHPTLGLLYPSRFIKLMYDTGKVAELDIYLFEETCRQLEQWEKEGRNYRISTNFTRVTISSGDFTDRILSILDRYRFRRDRLVAEITEDSLISNREAALSSIKTLKELGLRIALDDMGSGFSLFSDLNDFPLDLVKLDRDVLCDSDDEKGRNLMEGLIKTCKGMGLEILCEGVETKEQYEKAKEMGCDYIQGYYFYRPQTPEQLKYIYTRNC